LFPFLLLFFPFTLSWIALPHWMIAQIASDIALSNKLLSLWPKWHHCHSCCLAWDHPNFINITVAFRWSSTICLKIFHITVPNLFFVNIMDRSLLPRWVLLGQLPLIGDSAKIPTGRPRRKLNHNLNRISWSVNQSALWLRGWPSYKSEFPFSMSSERNTLNSI
jgi:hypothetical protein